MSRPDKIASRLRGSGEVKLVPYLMAGFPDAAATVRATRSLIAAGADALELGIPYSDPLADGPVIQQAGSVALAGGMTTARCLALAAELAPGAPPLLLMGYANPILAYGVERFASDAAAAGVAGVIVPDLPPEESSGIAGALREAGLATVFLVTPTSSEDRLEASCAASSGFVYCVTVTGITGARTELPATLPDLVGRVRRHTSLPVAAGFGISRPEHVAGLRGVVDAAVVGSALVSALGRGEDPGRLLAALKAAAATVS